MGNFSHLKVDVKRLRAEGKTYTEIREVLGIQLPKSTLSNWCRGVAMPLEHQERIRLINKANFKKAQDSAWASTRAKRQQLLAQLQELNKHLMVRATERDTQKIMLAMLYLGEGSKWRSHSGLMLGSSDPSIIQLYIRLLKTCYGITMNQLKCRVSYRADQDIRVLEKYWSEIAGVPLENFYKTKPDPRTIGKPTKQTGYKGVCVVHSGNTKIQHELEIIPRILLRGL